MRITYSNIKIILVVVVLIAVVETGFTIKKNYYSIIFIPNSNFKIQILHI